MRMERSKWSSSAAEDVLDAGPDGAPRRSAPWRNRIVSGEAGAEPLPQVRMELIVGRALDGVGGTLHASLVEEPLGGGDEFRTDLLGRAGPEDLGVQPIR
jgi:hypothetical protein